MRGTFITFRRHGRGGYPSRLPSVIAIGSLALLLVAMLAGSALANPYQVSGVAVEATAADAVTAKAEAIADGQTRAMAIVLRRITSAQYADQLPQLSAAAIDPMIAGISVSAEQTGPTRYAATLSFRFDPKAVRAVLDGAGVPATDTQAAPVLLIPVYKQGEDYFLWDNNPNLDAWRTFDTANTVTPIRLPEGNDIDRETDPNLVLARDIDTLSGLRIRYRVNEILIGLCETDPDRTAYACTLQGAGPSGPVDLREDFSGGSDPLAVAQAAAGSFLAQIEESWKAGNASASGDGRTGVPIPVSVTFNGLQEWQLLRSRLASLQGMGDIEIRAINPRGALLTLYYSQPIEQLAQDLSQYQLEFANAGESWVIRPY
jgi:hypothetical protein